MDLKADLELVEEKVSELKFGLIEIIGKKGKQMGKSEYSFSGLWMVLWYLVYV